MQGHRQPSAVPSSATGKLQPSLGRHLRLTCSWLCHVAGLLVGWQRVASLFAISLLLAYLNYRGLTIVGRVALAMTAFIIATFLVLCGLSLPHLQPANWGIVDLDAVEWRPFINIMFWCAAARLAPGALACCAPQAGTPAVSKVVVLEHLQGLYFKVGRVLYFNKCKGFGCWRRKSMLGKAWVASLLLECM